MGQIADKDFYNQIKGGTYGRLYLLYGEESYQKALYRERLINRAVSDDAKTFNLTKIQGKDFTVKELAAEMERLPVFSEKRVTEIVDIVPSKLSESAFKEMDELLSDIPETTVVVFYQQTEELSQKERKSDKKFIELINKYGFSVDFSLKDDNWLTKYVISSLAKEKIEIDYTAAAELVANSSGEIAFLNGEIEKLIAYPKDGKITSEIIKEVSTKSVEASRYDFAKFVVAKDPRKALHELDNLLFMKVKPMQILTALSSSFYDMYIVLSADIAKKSEKDIIDDFPGYKNRSFVLRNAKKALSDYSKKEIEKSLQLISFAEEELKGGKMEERIVLEKLVVRLMKGNEND